MIATETPTAMPGRAVVERTMQALGARGFHAVFVPTKENALRRLFELIPEGANVAHGGSTTLQQIGFVNALTRGEHGYRYLNQEWLAENDPQQRGRVRAVVSAGADYFLGSVQAVVESGCVVGADASGSRQAPYVFGPPHVIWVAGINKIVPTLDDAFRRLREVAYPLEDQRMKAAGMPGSAINKVVIYQGERPGRITIILVGESLGF